MKRIHPEDPRVTAHALGELPEHEALEVRHAVETNPAVQASLDETVALAELIRSGFKGESHELGEARREAIRRAGRRPQPENIVSMEGRRKWVRPAALTAAAAALVVCAVWVMQQIPVGEGGLAGEVDEAAQREGVRTEILLRSAPGRMAAGRQLPPDSSLYERDPVVTPEMVDEEFQALREMLETDPEAYLQRVKDVARTAGITSLAKLPRLADNPFIPTREEARSAIPIISGSASYHLAERFVRLENKLPPKNGVRIEELINQVVYEDSGDADLNGIKLGAELVRCPWDPGAIVMGILLHNGSERPITRDAILQVEMKPDFIRSYRLIGYAGAPGERARGNAVPQGLAPGKSNFVLYQLQPLDNEVFQNHRVLARIGLRLDNEHPRGLIVPVASPPRDWLNASNNLQTAVALGAWGMLLRDSPYAGKLTADMVGELAQDARGSVAAGDLVRREALQLALDSLPLLPAADR